MHGAIKLFTVIALFSLPTVMYGGYALLRLLTARKLNEFQVSYFRAGHAHAGVLLVLALVVLDVVARSGVGSGTQWVIGILLVVGVLAQPGGMFLHMAVGKPGTWSIGNTLSTAGAVVLAAALVTTAIGVISA
jgi:heme/copper-type cytochrome/quinol oxidase subunit 4